MKKVDEGEYFNAKLENNFSEFKVFKAEQYYTFEKSPSPEEVVSFSESFSSSKDRVAQNNNSTNNDSFDKLNKKLEQMNSNSGSESSTSSSLSSSTSSTTPTISTSTSSLASSTSASSVASVGATGASVATVAVASVAAVVIMGGVLIDVKPYIETTKGTDYVILTIDADKIKKANEVNNSIETENYSINIENNQSIKLQKGKQKYLITGLEPSTSYKYTLDCPDLKLGGSSTVYSSTFTTSESIEVSGVYDERNCSVVFDEASKSATYSFSLYLSDYEKQYENVSLYLTYEAVDEASDIQNYIALYDVMDEDNYFKNEIVDLRYKDVYMYMIGDKVDGTSNNDLLFSHHVEIDYPSHWGIDESPAFEVKASSEIDRSSPTQVKLQGEFTRYDDSYDLMCRVSLYDENDASLLEDAITPLQVGTSSYSFSLDARYGTKKYKYVIYTLDENNNEIILYTSPLISYTASQAYQASYTKVAPQDASITYFSDHVEIEVNPTYLCNSNIFEYRLEVLNSSSQVCGYYQGTENAIITINNVEVLDEINFIYYDIGHFPNKDVTYNSYSYSSGKEFCLPTIQMGEALGFDGTNFTLDYSISIADTYIIESIDLVVNDGTTDYTKNILSPSKRGTIALDHVEGALGEVGITLQLKFKDNQNDKNSHSLSSQTTSYTMNYEFEVTKTIADSFSATNTLPIDLYFNYRLPTTYSISIKDEANAVDITTGLAESYYLNTITPSSDINLVVQPLDESSNPVLQATTIHISSEEAKSIFESTPHSLNAVNPGDALITYNDDGTINMYRKTDFSCEDTRISMNAFSYETSATQSDGKTIYKNGHDSIESNGYSIIEDIPSNMYIFNYYICLDYENVRYISFMEYPSGTAGPSESIGSYEVSTASGENTIKVNISSYGYLENRIVVNGVEYQFTTYTSMEDSTASLTLPEEEITSVKVYFTEYGSSYETVASEIPIKGNKFKEYTL